MARIIGEVRPQYVFVENSPMLTLRGLGVVLADLSSMGFNAKWGVVSAANVGGNHLRERIWIRAETNVAYTDCQQRRIMEGGRTSFNGSQECGNLRRISDVDQRQLQKQIGQILANSMQSGLQGGGEVGKENNKIGQNAKLWRTAAKRSWWTTEPNVGRVANGLAARVDRLKAIGNGQVPLCAATAWELLK